MSQEIEKKISKSGTTTLGLVCKDGIVLAADKRGSYGSDSGVVFIASKREQKIFPITDKIAVTTAGVVSDLQLIVKLVKAELRLKQIKTKIEPSVREAANLFGAIVYQNIRKFSPVIGVTHFLLGGKDSSGFHLFEIDVGGAVNEKEKFVVSGSGMPLVYGVLETEYKEDINVEEGVKLAARCVNAAMQRDPGTGEGIDVFTITKEGVKHVLEQEVQKMLVTKKK